MASLRDIKSYKKGLKVSKDDFGRDENEAEAEILQNLDKLRQVLTCQVKEGRHNLKMFLRKSL